MATGDPVLCSTCNDTHWMMLGDREVMCTRCLVPCQQCRSDGYGPYCRTVPCDCVCHKGTACPHGFAVDSVECVTCLVAKLAASEQRAEAAEKFARGMASTAENERQDRVEMRRLLDDARAQLAETQAGAAAMTKRLEKCKCGQ